MPRPQNPVIAPEFNKSEPSGLRLPNLREISSNMSFTLRLLIDPEQSVHQIWYAMLDDGDADVPECKRRFQVLAKEWPRLFPKASTTEKVEDSDLHPALNGLGGAHFYGGWRRKFDDSSKLRGPIIFGMDLSLRSSCKVLGPTRLGSKVVIGTSAIVSRSIVCSDTKIDAQAQVGDSFIGRRCYIGKAVILEHVPLDGPVKILPGRPDRRDMTHAVEILNRKKCGSAIGDGCRIGSGSLLDPGTVLMPGCIVPPRTHLKAGVYRPEYFL